MPARSRSAPWRLAPLALGAVALGLAVGCSTGDAASPDVPPSQVGPVPLRRLSDREILNAVHDLFPSVPASVVAALPALPPDVPVAGFDNAAEGQVPSDVGIARYESLANAYAADLTQDSDHVASLVGCRWETPDAAAACAGKFVDTTGRRVFRRPLASDERGRLLAHFAEWQAAVDFEGAVRLTLSALLQSPQFLYRAEPIARSPEAWGKLVPVEPYALASRLSFFLWESAPDDALLDAAARGELGSEAGLRAEADRMLADDRASRLRWSFHRQWLGLDRILLAEHEVRTPDVDPSWSEATATSALDESRRFVEGTLAHGGTFRDLLTSRHAWVNGEMARVYGVAPPEDPASWTEIDLPEERAGLLTRTAFLAGFSHRAATSPPVRGNGIELRLLCQLPVSPPANADLSQPKASPDQGPQTNRMLFEERTKPAQCQACHAALNGFGFGLEGYNAAGHVQTTESGLTIDTSGEIHGTDVDGPFQGGVDLSEKLSRSEVVHRCATSQMVRYALGRAPVEEEVTTLTELARNFQGSGGDEGALVRAIVTSPTFRFRRVEEY